MSQETSSMTDRIIAVLKAKPGQKAREIADKLGLDKGEVNSLLYGKLRGQAVQDKAYRWWLKDDAAGVASRHPQAATKLNTPLAKLCRYYLDCIGYDDQGGVSVFAASKFNLDYVELPQLPLVMDEAGELFAGDAERKLLWRSRKDRNRQTIVLGYPVHLTFRRSRKGWQGYMVEPLFLFPLQEDPNNRYSPPAFEQEFPQINFKAFQSISGVGPQEIMEQAHQLMEELGLAEATAELPDFDEVAARLRTIRPEWEWREEPDPHKLCSLPSLAEADLSGIYNRAVLAMTERSSYTKGLETELAGLQTVEESRYRSTVVGAWLAGNEIQSAPAEPKPLLEVLPLNTEQRQAVLQGLTNPLTIITGPPGTGKSQVVTSLLINAAWQGKTVLFASKNNKAVDVVETRVNALGPRPVLLRLGRAELQANLSAYLTALLAASSSPEDESNFRNETERNKLLRDRFSEYQNRLEQTVEIRNRVDQQELEVEHFRQELGNDIFSSFRGFEAAEYQKAVDILCSAADAADKQNQSFLTRLLWTFRKRDRYRHLEQYVHQLRQYVDRLAVSRPAGPPSDQTIGQWLAFADSVEKRLADASEIADYFRSLEELKNTPSVEQVSRDLLDLVEQLTENSEALWDSWLQMQPRRLSGQDRQLLGNYSSLLQMIVSCNEGNRQANRTILKKFYDLFPHVSKILTCWAVTSLSARGRIPLEPGFFDLVVIDEASQCDIASAIPLLYRAKRAVIIGDPKQLRHISGLPRRQDQQLLVQHEIVDQYSGWAYAPNSLFDLAVGRCRSEDIISLRDHHRSHADIIGFSNQYFYENKLRIATSYQRLKPVGNATTAVRWLNVTGQVVRPGNGGALNESEAQAVVRELERMVLQQGYDGTVGVVSPFRAQANLVQELVHQHHSLSSHLMRMDFLSDTVYRFQGDERDLIFFSPVVSAGMTATGLGFLRVNPNIFNVAITRARSALIVVGDQAAALCSGVEYLGHFAEYVAAIGDQPTQEDLSLIDLGGSYPSVSNPEQVSEWEKYFYVALYTHGHRPIPQYGVEKYVLDFALFAGDRKLNIEIDGERYHRNWDGELCRRDQIRNQRLIELGWDVMRFWVYQIRDDLPWCLERVKSWLDR